MADRALHDNVRRLLIEGEDRRKIARSPFEARNASIVSLTGLIELGREKYGPELVQVATELLASLEDLNNGGKPSVFEPSWVPHRPPPPKHRRANMTLAVALIDYPPKNHGSLAEWMDLVARRFKLKVSALKSFRKRLSVVLSKSVAPRAWADAIEVYRDASNALQRNNWEPIEALDRLAQMIVRSAIK